MSKAHVFFTAVGVVSLALHPAEAAACSAPILCGSKVLVAPGDEVPSNLQGVLLDPYDARLAIDGKWSVDRADTLQLTLHAESAPDNPLPIHIEKRPKDYLWVAFEQPLQVGERYVLTVRESCEYAELDQQITFIATAPEPPPTGLGGLKVVPSNNNVVPYVSGGLCSEDIAVSAVDVQLAEPPGVSVAAYRLLVDGEPWRWALSASGSFYRPGGEPDERPYWFIGPGTFRVWSECEVAANQTSARGLAPGKHTVKVQAELLGSTRTTLDSEPIEVDLLCPRDSSTDRDGEADVRGPIVEEREESPAESTVAAGTASDGGDARAPESRLESGGDGCNIAHGPRAGSAALSLLLGVAWLWARRTHGRRRGRQTG